eukprot:m.158748 g.158748  ORF g.158748 m.158748 type:complete len:56 (+) comp53002_c0_seq4:128-295(+)
MIRRLIPVTTRKSAPVVDQYSVALASVSRRDHTHQPQFGSRQPHEAAFSKSIHPL